MIAPVPRDLKEEVRLVDHHWLGQQAAEGARLTLLDRDDVGAAEEARAYREELGRVLVERDRLKAELEAVEVGLGGANGPLLAALLVSERRAATAEKAVARLDSQVLPLKAEVNQLRLDLHQAERPFWRRRRRRRARQH